MSEKSPCPSNPFDRQVIVLIKHRPWDRGFPRVLIPDDILNQWHIERVEVPGGLIPCPRTERCLFLADKTWVLTSHPQGVDEITAIKVNPEEALEWFRECYLQVPNELVESLYKLLENHREPRSPLVGIRKDTVAFLDEKDKLFLNPQVKGLEKFGFPSDWFLPLKLARNWKLKKFPLFFRPDSIAAWKKEVSEDIEKVETASADLPVVNGETMTSGEKIAQELWEDLAHDEELIRQFDSDLLKEQSLAESEALQIQVLAQTRPKKRSTESGEARAKLIAVLTKHHKYADGGCLNLEPIGNNELAIAASVSGSTASNFFKKAFKGYGKYRVICLDGGRLADSLKALNGEFAPHDLYGRRPAGEDDRNDDE